MSKTYAFSFPDGSVGYGYQLTAPRIEDESDEEYAARIAALSVPVAIDNDVPAVRAPHVSWPTATIPAGTVLDRRAAEAIEGATFTPLSFEVIAQVDIPSDRAFRRGWKLEGSKIVHDMPRCRAIQRDRIREARRAVMANLDALWMRAMGQGQTAAAAVIEAKRQAWRDAPADPRIEAAADIDALKAVPLPEL